MDGMKIGKMLRQAFSKYRYTAMILLVGILLMLIPNRDTQKVTVTEIETVSETLEERLERILSTIDGAGEVRVLLTVAHGEKIIFQTDTDTKRSTEDEADQSKTVLLKDNQGGEVGLVQQTNPPNYLGAVVTCRGADNPVVRLMIVEAVSTATGLGADRISVMKMK